MSDTRTAQVTITELPNGAHLVHVSGSAQDAYAVGRSAATLYANAVLLATFGDLQDREPECPADGPAWTIGTNRADVIVRFNALEDFYQCEYNAPTGHTFADYATVVAREAYFASNGGMPLREAIDYAFGVTDTDGYPVNPANEPTPHERAVIHATVALMQRDCRASRVRVARILPRDRGGAIVHAHVGSNEARTYIVHATARTILQVSSTNR